MYYQRDERMGHAYCTRLLTLLVLLLIYVPTGPVVGATDTTEVCLGASSGAITQGSLYPDLRLEVGHRSNAMASGDVNGDGNLDLVAVNESNEVTVLLGRGDGTFEAEMKSELGKVGSDLVLRDFDRDGKLDVAVHGYNQNYVAVGYGNGDGTFGPEVQFSTGLRGLSIAAGDFNGDGFEDLVSPNLYDFSASVLLGREDGTFEGEFRLPAGRFPWGVGTGDLNGDGFDDVVVANSDHDHSDEDASISVYLTIGPGAFAPAVLYAVGAFPLDVAVADWNGDGLADLAVANAGSDDISILIAQGAGKFAAQSRMAVGDNPEELSHADVNADGVEDLVVTGDSVTVLLGNGDGTFSTGGVPPGIGFASSAVVVDLDRDGHLDLAVLRPGWDSSVSLGFGDGTGTSFTGHPQQQSRHGVGDRPSSIVATDLDRDGHLDLVTANRDSDDLSVLMGVGGGRFLPESRLLVGRRPVALDVADFNADMLPDLAVLHEGSGDVRVLLGLGNGFFQAVGQFIEEYPRDILAIDLTMDGLDDLVILRSGELIVMLGLGDGTFGSAYRTNSSLYARALASGDLNLDGLVDLVVVGGDETFVHLGRGDGTLEPAIVHGPNSLSRSLWDVVVADYTGDGIPDTVNADTASDAATVYPGDGQGNLDTYDVSSSRVYRTEDFPRFLLLADLNSDGQSDVASANRYSNSVSVLLGQTRSLSRSLSFEVGQEPAGIAYGDFNGDGRPDLAVANAGSDDISILLNRGVLSNLPPNAHAGWSVERDCALGVGTVLLDASGSIDLNSSPGTLDDIVTFEWWHRRDHPEPDVLLGTSPMLQVTFPMDEHNLFLKVVDSHGHRSYDHFRLDMRDTVPPSISVTLSKDVLWPPNHRLVEVDAFVNATDDCGGVQVVLESVVSDEPDDAPGSEDGATGGDVAEAEMGTADMTLRLRAERDGNGDGRIYTVTYRASDSSGNSASASALVSVPHDLGGFVEPVMLVLSETASGTLIHWGEVPGAGSYGVVRGELGRLKEFNGSYHVAPLRCIAAAITETTTTSQKNPEQPSLGEGFFYLVGYDGGFWSGYGTESAAKERFVPPGQACH